MASHTTHAVASGNLVDLVLSSGAATIYPSDDIVLQARFRGDLPYTRVGASNLVVVNPCKALNNLRRLIMSDADTSPPIVDTLLHELAARIGMTGVGKSSSVQLVVCGSPAIYKEAKLAEQVKAVTTVLDSVRNSTKLMSPNASRLIRCLIIHFNERGRIAAASFQRR
ncbi:hypothetical protein CPB85DRAFT_1436889 [Mucidula mucida]|nr:hypothetical protein CPB85DRAFT_1436889 [Mucidula mucida]